MTRPLSVADSQLFLDVAFPDRRPHTSKEIAVSCDHLVCIIYVACKFLTEKLYTCCETSRLMDSIWSGMMPCIDAGMQETAAGLMGWNDQSYPQVFVLTAGCDYQAKLTVIINRCCRSGDNYATVSVITNRKNNTLQEFKKEYI